MRPAGKNAREIGILRALWAAGLRPPARCTVPEVLAYIAAEDCLVTEFAPGTLVSEILRNGGDAAVAMRRSAEWLTVLHASRTSAAERDDTADQLLRWRRELMEAAPAERLRISNVCDSVRDHIADSAADLVPSHGDYHPEHLFIDADRVTAIDFDRFGLRPRADDIGLWMARTATILLREQGTFVASERLRREFLASYGLRAALADVGAWMALYFVKSLWFGIAKRKRPHLERVDPLLWAASRCLAGDLSLASR
jgi:aminoglycoside phosphotransferase (APT) family kinase protein